LDCYVAFTPAETALTPENVRALIGDGSRIRRGAWSYAGNGYIAKGTTAQSQCPFGGIDLAGTTVIQASNGSSAYTQIYITPPTNSATPNAIAGEMLYYIDNGSGYSPTWYRVITNNNYASILDGRYVNASGDTMTGFISYKTTNYTSTPVAVYDDGTNYGHSLVIGAGGTTYIGAGESASTLYSTKLKVASTEDLILGADSNIRFHTNADNATTTSGVTLNTSNSFYP
jgi:hypothetical protein